MRNTIFLTWQLLDGEAEMLPGPGLGDGNIPPIGGDLQKSSFVSAGRNWSVVGKLRKMENQLIMDTLKVRNQGWIEFDD